MVYQEVVYYDPVSTGQQQESLGNALGPNLGDGSMVSAHSNIYIFFVLAIVASNRLCFEFESKGGILPDDTTSISILST